MSPDPRHTVFFPRTCAKDVSAAVAPRSEVVVVAVGAVELFVLGGERLVDERAATVAAVETLLMPVPILVRQILQEETSHVYKRQATTDILYIQYTATDKQRRHAMATRHAMPTTALTTTKQDQNDAKTI